MRHFFTVSRFIILLAVIDSLLMSVTLLIYGSIDSLRMFLELFKQHGAVRGKSAQRGGPDGHQNC